MAVVTDFIQSRSQVIEAALRKIGVLSLNGTVTSAQMAAAVQALNSVVKAWQTKNLFLWTLKEFDLELIAGTERYTIQPGATGVTNLADDLLGFDQAYWLNNLTWERIAVISYRQYLEQPDKETAGGFPIYIATSPTEAPLTAFVYPSPTEAYDLKILGIAKARDWDNTTDTGQIPTRFQQALIYSLAADLAPEYGIPLAERQYLEGKAATEFASAKQSDRDRSDCETVRGAFD
jgi:hypothetical protein